MKREEYNLMRETILDLIEKEKTYCAGYVKNNPADKKHREMIRDYIVSGMNNVLAAMKAQVNRGNITIE